MRRRGPKPALLIFAIAVFAAAASSISVALAAQATHGVRSLAPKDDAVVPLGTTPTFKVRVKGKGVVYFRICQSKKRDNEGQACSKDPDDIDRGKKGAKTRRGRLYTFTPEKFTFPEYYLNRPGTYYWQAYRIFCIRIPGRRALDCIQEGPIRKFQVQ
jgi:hypothetical protein